MINESQFIRLFVEHEPSLKGFAISLMPCAVDAQDVLQDACVAMWQKIGTLRDEEGFVPWALTFVRLTALNHIRKKRRSKLVFSEELIELNSIEAEGEVDRAQAESRLLRECINHLPPKQQDLVRRYYASTKVRMQDVARQLERPVAGLYKALERTRAVLRDCIERRLEGEGYPISSPQNEP